MILEIELSHVMMYTLYYYFYKYTTGKNRGTVFATANNVRIITYNRGGACVVRDRDGRNMLLFG